MFDITTFFCSFTEFIKTPKRDMSSTQKTQKPFKILNFEGRYSDFTDFYDLNKTDIYKSIVDLFIEFNTTKTKTLSLHITAKIKGLDWDTEFTFHKDETIILTRDVMPYFEKIEDYETCQKIKNLHEDLTKSKI